MRRKSQRFLLSIAERDAKREMDRARKERY